MQEFYDLQEIVFSYLQNKNRSERTILNYQKCYDRLERYLVENNIPFSLCAVDEWLEKISMNMCESSQRIFKTQIIRLKDASTDSIITRHFSEKRLLTYNLSSEFKNVLDGLLESFNDCAKVTVSNRRAYICHILLKLQEHNVFCFSDFSYDILMVVLDEVDNGKYYSKHQNIEMMNYLLTYLYDNGLISYGFTLLKNMLGGRAKELWIFDDPHILTMISQYKSSPSISSEYSLEEYRYNCQILINTHLEYRYSRSYVGVIQRIVNQFYLFLDYNGLNYSTDIGEFWLNCIEDKMSHSSFNNYHRVIQLLKQIPLTGKCDIRSYFPSSEPLINTLPEWCKRPAIDFISLKIREKWADSTIDDFRSAIYRFCKFLVDISLTSFEDLDAEIIKQFNTYDKHLTPQGKNAYNSRIRKFIEYLSAYGYIENQWLFLALNNVSAPGEPLVVTLTDEEQDELKKVLRSSGNTLSLRDKAIINLGLYMGIRGCDIVNLTLDNINWEKATISFVQLKTSHGIELPMPDQVANSIYQYIMYERPDSKCKKIFIKHQAPYDGLSRNMCLHALEVALPNRNVSGSGFHVIRKTCATNLLRNGASATVVMETLGHRDTSNIKKYLSLDEANMRLCPLSLSECGLILDGGSIQ